MPQTPERKRAYNRDRNRRLRNGEKPSFSWGGGVGGDREYEGKGVVPDVVPVLSPEEAVELVRTVRRLEVGQQVLRDQISRLQQRATLTEAQMALLEALVRQAEEWRS